MKLTHQLFAALSLTALVAGTTSEALAAEAEFQASAEVIDAISIQKDRDLNFGAFTPAGGGTVTVAADSSGTRTSSGPTLSGSTNASAQFTVSGDPNATFDITVPPASTLSSGANTMAITFTDSGAGTGSLDGSGSATIYVGGELTVGAAQASGSYTGNFNVTVEYN